MKLPASQRWFWPVALLLLGIMGVTQVLSVREEAQTFDEGFDLAAGYSYWKTGEFRINTEHPPAGKWIDAAPLLFFKPKLPIEHPSWKQRDNAAFGREFLYHNTVPADTMLFAGRMMSVAATLSFGLVLALWTKREFGALAAALALLFFSFDPNVIAHGRYITSDIFVTVFSFLSCISWARFLVARRKPARIPHHQDT